MCYICRGFLGFVLLIVINICISLIRSIIFQSFYQANLNKIKWRKGIIDIKMVSPKTAKLKILGSMSGATDFTAKHGLVK